MSFSFVSFGAVFPVVVITMQTMHVITEKFDGLNTDAYTRTIQYDGQNDRCGRPDHTI